MHEATDAEEWPDWEGPRSSPEGSRTASGMVRKGPRNMTEAGRLPGGQDGEETDSRGPHGAGAGVESIEDHDMNVSFPRSREERGPAKV